MNGRSGERLQFFARCVAMMTRTLLARCAPLAIAASAALPVMPANAQDAATPQPVIVLPPAETAPVATAPAPSPAIVLPAPAPAVAAPVQTTQAPVAETSTSPAEAVSAPARTTRSTAIRRSAPAAAGAAAPAAEAAPSQPVSQSSIDEMTARPITPPATTEIAPTVAACLEKAEQQGLIIDVETLDDVLAADNEARRMAQTMLPG